jgi:DNA-binding transcriptional LysR family regulator
MIPWMRKPRPSNNEWLFHLRDLERFVAIVEHRNFGRAAKVLRTTQPSLSRAIAGLELHLGTMLFSRAHRQIELTPAGEVLWREAPALLAHAASVLRVMREAASGTLGNIRVGALCTSRFTLIPQAIRRLRELHPQFSVMVIDTSPGLEIEELRDGNQDVTLLRGPLKTDSELRRARLRSDPMVLALAEHHPLAQRSVVESRDLAEESFVELAAYRSHGYRELGRGVCARAGFVPHVAQEVATIDALATCVAAGIGVALMHDVAAELPVPGVVFRPVDPAPPPVELHAVWRANDDNPALESFVECLVAAASSEDASTSSPQR